MTTVVSDFEARRIIENLRSGVPSRNIGRVFSSARGDLLERISDQLDGLTLSRSGMVLLGKYGEGKTHLLNTIFSMASAKNMVVSMATLSKETPMDKLHLVYPRLIANTYLPGRAQPGFQAELDSLTQGESKTSDLLLFAGKKLLTDKLFYLLNAYLNTEDNEEKFQLLADLEGDLMPLANLKAIYRRIFAEKFKFSENFVKTRHMSDYFAFMSFFFRLLGYSGWVILLDEAELIGQLGKKARLNAYANMSKLLNLGSLGIYSLFAFTASFTVDVIEYKHERENLEALQLPKAEHDEIEDIIEMISSAPELATVSDAELLPVLAQIRAYHGQAYGWQPHVEADLLLKSSDVRKPLRTRIRVAVEILDQLFQYGRIGNISICELMEIGYEEEIPLPEDLSDLPKE